MILNYKLFVQLVMKYVMTTSHKIIGILYGYIGYIFGIIGYIVSMLIRSELNTTGLSIVRKVKEVNIYNNWITIHGLIMIFVFIMPVAIGYYGNYLIPLLIGTSELSMPRINGISYYMLIIGIVIFFISTVIISKPISSGWTLYPPLSTRDGDNTGFNIDLSLLVVHVLGISSTLGSVNYITTNKYNRHNGLIMLSINIYNFSIVVTSILLIGSLPILGVGITGLLLDRNINSSIYDITGDPVLYQHLFWFFGHPEVYVIILPVFGLCSLMLTSLIHKDIFGREGMIYCLISIGVIGYFVWAHHMFVIGLDIDSRSYFSIATSIISIPTSVKIFSYINTWASGRGYRGSNSSWSFFSFLICFCFGGFTGLILSSPSLDIILHDTYFVVGHFHTVLSLAATYGLLMAHYFFLPIIFSYSIFESLSFYHTLLLFIGAMLVFYPMHLAGLSGMARRVPEYADYFTPFTIVGFHGTLLLMYSTIIFIRSFNMYLSNVLHGNYR
jgi:heme/copper-type cytochrome/quinol oxidase subunit 1